MAGLSVRRLVTIGLLAVAGCGGDTAAPKPSPKPAGTIDRAALATETAVAVPPHRTLHFRAADGKRLHGTLTPAERPHAPAVVLVHQLRGGPEQWAPLIASLHRAGLTSLAYASRDAAELDEVVLARDLVGAIAALRRQPEVDRNRIVLGGASIGGTTVSYVLGTRRLAGVRGGVGLSAVESATELRLGDQGRFRPHDLLLISDEREALNADNLAEDARGRGITRWIAPISGHGVALLPDPRVRAKVIGWLKRLTAGARG